MATPRRIANKRAAAKKPARKKRPVGAKKPGGTRRPAGAKKAGPAKKPAGARRAAGAKKPTRNKTAGRRRKVAGAKKAATTKRAARSRKPTGAKTPARAAKLQTELGRARKDLEIRTAELEAAQARFTELEQRLRLIHESRPYRLAWRLWRIRARARAPFSRLRAAPAGSEQAGSPAAADRIPEPGEVLYAAGYMEVSDQPLKNVAAGGVEAASSGRDFEQEYHGSRGVRAVDPEQTGPLRPVLLLGGMTEAELAKALRTLNGRSPAEPEPLIITDCDALRTLDASGYLYEYVPPREDWEQRLGRDGRGYDEFVRRRLASIAGMYELTDLPPEELIPAT